MSNPYFTAARRTQVQSAVNALAVSTTAKQAAMATYDDMLVAETFLRTAIGDDGPSHDIDTILHAAWSITNIRLEMERKAGV